MKKLSDIGLVGLGVMGRSLALNMESKGFQLSVYNYVPSVTEEFMAGAAAGRGFVPAYSYEELVAGLESPKKVFLMVTAGKAVDEVVGKLVPLLSEGDVIIDGGNSDYRDTTRRARELAAKGILFVGTGVSGGEEGALKGPSMMPGGDVRAWPLVAPIFRAISAKAPDGASCCEWMGPEGAGHYVKMVHNGIEYGDIELICECYQLMRDGLGMSNAEIQEVFAEWNEGELSSYLIDITADILAKKDAEGNYVLDSILDTAGQKGTGKWTVEAALDEGEPLTLIAEAVFARCLSARKEERVAASAVLAGPDCHFERSREISGPPAAAFLADLRDALYAAKIVSYAQGFSLLEAASESHGWGLDCGKIARIWRGGCIIRSVFLDTIHDAFAAPAFGSTMPTPSIAPPGHTSAGREKAAGNIGPVGSTIPARGQAACHFERSREISLAPRNLMLSPFFREQLARCEQAWRRVVCAAIGVGIPVPALSSALSYYDSYRCARSGANLLQAQRDYFGAHTYERIDRPRGEFFHTEW